MDQDLAELLRTILRADPEQTLDDDKRQAIVYAMLGLHEPEFVDVLWKFTQSVQNDAKRSHLLRGLVRRSAESPTQLERAERIARSIPDTFSRFSALNDIVSQLLRLHREFSRVSPVAAAGYYEKALTLLKEVQEGLPSIPEDDGERVSVLWRAGLSLVDAGKLDWAEALVVTDTYHSEHVEVLLSCARARLAQGAIAEALRLAEKAGGLSVTGLNDHKEGAYDLRSVSQLMFEAGKETQARPFLRAAAEHALAGQEELDIDGSKCLAAVSIEFAKQGYLEQAIETANKVTQPARRNYALQEIAKHGPGRDEPHAGK